MKKFPYKVTLVKTGKRWLAWRQEHGEVKEWLVEHYGMGGGRWFCNDAGIYHFRDALDALEFKLRWA